MGIQNAKTGAILGGLTGLVLGAGVTVVGGYEIGTALNNYIGLSGNVGRAMVDLVVMGVAAGPCLSIGFYSGAAVGGLTGAAIGK